MRITAHITPNASRSEITGRSEDGRFRIRIQAPPIEGAANKKLIAFIAKRVGVSKSGVRIIRGEKSRDKVLEIDGNEKEIIRCMEEGK